MYLKNEKITATLGPVVMRSHKTGMGNEFLLDSTAVVGWTDGASTRRDAVPRLGTSGDFSEKATISARLISFSGIAVAKTIPDLQNMRDVFVGLLVHGGYETLKVQTVASTRFATVGLEGSTNWVQTSDISATWKITLYAPDPRIYGEPRTTSVGTTTVTTNGGLSYPLTYPIRYNISTVDRTAVSVTNLGNTAAWPSFVVTGDYPDGFTISDNLDHTVTYNGMVTTQSPVTIDMERGVAIQGDVDKTIFVSKRQWFSIEPGQVVRPEFKPTTSGTGWCDIIVRDTWI